MKYKIHNTIDGKDIITTEIVVHSFTLSDVDDPDVYAGQPIYEWQQSEAGKWITANAFEKPNWRRQIDHMTCGYQYIITARLTPKQVTFFKLKYE